MLTWDEFDEANSGQLAQYQIIRRNGAVVPFEPNKIATAMMKVFMAGYHAGACIACAGFFSGNLPSSLFSAPAIFRRWILATASSTKHHLFALSKLVGAMIKLQPDKANGFFSASKANLRNAP